MTRCRYDGGTLGDWVLCGNTADMIHGGKLPADWCVAECPYRKAADYLSDSARLAARASTPYRPAPKSCGGCGTVKRRDAATQFVWPYFHGAASGEIGRAHV